jgi:hypothetical protein
MTKSARARVEEDPVVLFFLYDACSAARLCVYRKLIVLGAKSAACRMWAKELTRKREIRSPNEILLFSQLHERRRQRARGEKGL